MLTAVSPSSGIENLPPKVNPETSINYISQQEDLALVSWVTELRYKKANWGLFRGKFYFIAFEMLGDGDRHSPTFGSFRQLAIYLHENYKIASPSRAYELRRAYLVHLQVLDLKLDIPAKLPFTTEILLELEKVRDEHFQEAVEWCLETWQRTGELRANGFLALLQEHYPDIDWLRRKPKEPSETPRKPQKKNLVELEEALKSQRQQIDEQRSQLEQLSTNHQSLEEELTTTARERDALRQQNEALARRVQELELLLSSTTTEEPPLDSPRVLSLSIPFSSMKDEEPELIEPAPLVFASSVEKALNRKREEGMGVKIISECGDWALYDEEDKYIGGVEEGNEEALEKVINSLVPKSITELIQSEDEITCTADPETGFYLLKRPDIDPEKPEEPEAFSSASIVIAQIHRILTRSTIGDRTSRRFQWD